MNPDSITSRLVGTWHAVPNFDGMVVYFRLLDDLRYIGASYVTEKVHGRERQRWMGMRVWMVMESDSVLRCSYKIGGSTWTRGIHFEGECLILDGTCPATAEEPESARLFYRCHRIAEEDLPEGVEEVFDKVMAKEWT